MRRAVVFLLGCGLNFFPSFRLIFLVFFLSFGVFVQPSGAQSQAGSGPEANPGRPTVSTPATLTPVGYLQFESGFQGASESPEFSSLYNFNEVVKFTVAPRLELLAAGEPIAHFTAEGKTANGVADFFLGAQGVLYQGEGAKPTLAVSYFRRVYNGGAPDLDIGSASNSFLVLASADVRGFHYDANAFLNEVAQGPVRRAQFGQSLTISHLLTRRVALSGEIWHFTQPFLRGNAVGNLWAVSYEARKDLVFDVGFNRGLTGTSTQWEEVGGFTYLLPHRLWSRRGGN
ncbi:MAG: hypothetical protein ACRD33_10220 [Candidatus Acidiferrales bacterium]